MNAVFANYDTNTNAPWCIYPYKKVKQEKGKGLPSLSPCHPLLLFSSVSRTHPFSSIPGADRESATLSPLPPRLFPPPLRASPRSIKRNKGLSLSLPFPTSETQSHPKKKKEGSDARKGRRGRGKKVQGCPVWVSPNRRKVSF